jgi:hypothetical protein
MLLQVYERERKRERERGEREGLTRECGGRSEASERALLAATSRRALIALLDGGALMRELGVARGPGVKAALDLLLRYQLARPEVRLRYLAVVVVVVVCVCCSLVLCCLFCFVYMYICMYVCMIGNSRRCFGVCTRGFERE